MMPLPDYEVFAIRYATRNAVRRDHFLGGDPHEAPMPMDYFVWLVKGPQRSFVVDCGFTAEVAAARKRTHLLCPVDALQLLGVEADAVADVVITHLHYDHVGNFHRFPRARFHIQEPEIHYAVGRHMRHAGLSHPFEVEDIVGVVRLNYAGRVEFYDGDHELAPGLTLHACSGHSVAIQFVRVHTRRGWIVLASDTTHFYENLETGRPFPGVVCLPGVFDAYQKVRALADSPAHIIPGHDPLVMERYPAPLPELAGIAVRLDVAPCCAGA